MNSKVIKDGWGRIARRSLIFAYCLLPIAFLLSGCRQDMHNNPKFKPYREGANRQLPEGTIARGSLELNPPAPKVGVAQPQTAQGSAQPAGAGAAAQAIPTGEDGFPFQVTKEILDRGESRFNISCSPCHGKLGDGNGMIALRGFKHPPSYHNDRLRKAPSSYFYDVITNGFGVMPSYADQLTPEDRWKVIAWVRVLQYSQNAAFSELAEKDKKALAEAERNPEGRAPEGHGTK
ncbi:MAG: cytochrome c [Blastocatellia bacterium]|nr:cytochrome c [Blastocatellia bacterium]